MGKWQLPLKNNRNCSNWVFLKAFNDFWCFITVDAIDGPALDHF